MTKMRAMVAWQAGAKPKLPQAAGEHMMSGKARFRVVLRVAA